jgi:hypothetical protein
MRAAAAGVGGTAGVPGVVHVRVEQGSGSFLKKEPKNFYY